MIHSVVAVTFVRVLAYKAGESWMLFEKCVCSYSSIAVL